MYKKHLEQIHEDDCVKVSGSNSCILMLKAAYILCEMLLCVTEHVSLSEMSDDGLLYVTQRAVYLVNLDVCFLCAGGTPSL